MCNPTLCYDLWTIRQLSSDDFGQEHWDNDDSINYHPIDNDQSDNGNSVEIGNYDNDDELMQDLMKFAGKMLHSFVSLAL
jgi:hypothetical protein